MKLSEALMEMIEIIQTGDHYNEEYELMLADFITHIEGEDTIRMSFEMARQQLSNKKPKT